MSALLGERTMKIQGVNFVHTPQNMSGPHRVGTPSTANSLGEVDHLDISPTADLASRALEAPAVRGDRVAQIRSAIEAGSYDTDEKLSLALDRLLDEIA
jgi:negative regulator of flagellin synthesis FlgM